jgi:hypothetical protein
MQQCCCQYGQSHEAEQDESGSRRQKTIERKCSIDGCICGNRTGGGKDARNVLLWDGSDAGGDFVATRPFARRDQQCGKDSGEENAHAWAEQALLDGEAHEKDAVERQRQAADPTHCVPNFSSSVVDVAGAGATGGGATAAGSTAGATGSAGVTAPGAGVETGVSGVRVPSSLMRLSSCRT